MESIPEIIEELRETLNNLDFSRLSEICDKYFGEARQKGTSHRVYKTPWIGDPRVNIQAKNGKAKPYQVRQVIKALWRLEAKNGD